MPIGNRIFTKRPMPDKALLEAFSKIPTANVADTMHRMFLMQPRIRLMSNPPHRIMVGAALTVNAPGGDNLLLHYALDIVQPGDVIVMSNNEETSRALMGEVMLTHLFRYRGASGIVLDGPIRDSDAAAEFPYPIFATGATSAGPYKNGPGEVNVPISCGGVCVHPGDIILGDADGVLVIPLADAPQILEKAQALNATDSAKVERAAYGKNDRSWVSKTIESTGVEILSSAYEERNLSLLACENYNTKWYEIYT